MSSTRFTIDRRDIRFVLFEQLDLVGAMSKYPSYADFDEEMYQTMLDEAEKISVEVLAQCNKGGDAGCTFDGAGNVTTPPGFKESWAALGEGGWLSLSASPDFGGMGLPHVMDAAVQEMFTGANMAFATYPGLARAAANLLIEYAPDSIRQLVVEKLFSGEWGGTMCLTEADAGSSVGDNRAKASPTDEPGVYTIEGEKVFITAGDQDITENIVHLVLARAPGAPAGTKGLSIFLVPKFDFAADGSLGERNDAFVSGIEEKMGLHGSATTTLVLGANGPCKGWLLGQEGAGMSIMFHMMNEARIGVAIQGLAGASAAYNYALAYAGERVQGSDIENIRDPDAPSVPIVRHPDVRRMLMMQKVLVETMRSLVYTTAMRNDRANLTEDTSKREFLSGLVELMTPILKSHCTDIGFECTVLAVQVFGGYGYIGEYPVEQVLRDTKIGSIYEGTNGIQAMDLLGRKMRKGSGALFMSWMGVLNKEIERVQALGQFEAEVKAIEKARDVLGATAMHLGGLGMQGNIKGAMVHASPFLTQFGHVVLALQALWQARVAHDALAAGDVSEDDARFYKSKLLNLSFFCNHLLPGAIALGKSIQSGDESCLDDAAFG